MDIPSHNRWSGSYVIQPRHMGGFYSQLIKKVLRHMFTKSQIIGFRARIIIAAALIFIVSSCAGCSTLTTINLEELKDAANLTQPFALTRTK